MQITLLFALVSISSFAVQAMMPHPVALSMKPISFLASEPPNSQRLLGRVGEGDVSVNGVANIMTKVEQRWLQWALELASVDCSSTNNAPNCTTNVTKEYALGNFTKSCDTVSQAIVKTSGGDKSRVQAYMSNVCGQDSLKGIPEELCLDFSQYLVKEMSEYQHANLEGGMNLNATCMDFFNNGYVGRYGEEQRQRLAQAQAAKEAGEQRKAEEAADAQAKAELETKATVARKRLEKMQNATAHATAKREDAVRAAVDAQRKAEESEEAEEVQKRLKMEAETAEAEAKAAKDKVESMDKTKAARNANQTVETATTANVESHNRTAKFFLDSPAQQ